LHAVDLDENLAVRGVRAIAPEGIGVGHWSAISPDQKRIVPGPHCIPTPFDGSLLQIMPWPIYQNMTDHELRAIYEYLSAIPCLEGDPGNPTGSDTHGQRCH
jgi:hypothetical protein